MFSQKGIIMARHKDVRNEIGTINYILEETKLKNKKFNLTEYFQIQKEKKKEDKTTKKETKKVTKKIQIDDSKLKENEMMDLLTKPKKETSEEKKLHVEEKKEEKQEQLEKFVDLKVKHDKQKEEEIQDIKLKDEFEEVAKSEEIAKPEEIAKSEEIAKPEVEETPVIDNTKKKIVIDMENLKADKDKEMFQL